MTPSIGLKMARLSLGPTDRTGRCPTIICPVGRFGLHAPVHRPRRGSSKFTPFVVVAACPWQGALELVSRWPSSPACIQMGATRNKSRKCGRACGRPRMRYFCCPLGIDAEARSRTDSRSLKTVGGSKSVAGEEKNAENAINQAPRKPVIAHHTRRRRRMVDFAVLRTNGCQPASGRGFDVPTAGVPT